MPTTITDAIRASLDGFSDTWNHGGGTALGDFFADDASIINPFGQRADGRATIAAMYADYFTGMLAGTRSTVELLTARPVGEHHAFIDATQTITAPDGTPILALHLAAMLTDADGDWKFVDSRPYSYASPPA